MLYCPQCKTPLRLVAGDKYWVHDSDKPNKCPITSMPNDFLLLQKFYGLTIGQLKH